jgi:hypothetical protein
VGSKDFEECFGRTNPGHTGEECRPHRLANERRYEQHFIGRQGGNGSENADQQKDDTE